MSNPIPIPSSSRSRSTYAEAASNPRTADVASSSSPSSGLYIPLHRRHRDVSPVPSSSSESGFASSPTYSAVSANWPPLEHTFDSQRFTPGVYSREDLLRLAHSPLAKLNAEVKAEMRDVVPDIVLSRRKAETKRWRVRQEEHQPRQRDISPQASHSDRRGSWDSDEWRWQS